MSHTAGAFAPKRCIDATSEASSSLSKIEKKTEKWTCGLEKKAVLGACLVDEKANSLSWSYDSQYKAKTLTWNHMDLKQIIQQNKISSICC